MSIFIFLERNALIEVLHPLQHQYASGYMRSEQIELYIFAPATIQITFAQTSTRVFYEAVNFVTHASIQTIFNTCPAPSI